MGQVDSLLTLMASLSYLSQKADTETPKAADLKKNVQQRTENTFKKENVAEDTSHSSSMPAKPPTWGGGRSFADVLKKDEIAA